MPMSSSPVTAPSPKETPTDTPSPSNNSSSSTSPSPAEESSPPPASPPPSSPPPASPPPAETTPPPKQSSPPPQAVSPPPKVVSPPPQETTPPAPPTSPPPSPALPKTPPSLPPPVAKTPPSPIPNQPTFSPPPPVAKSPPSGSLSPPPPHAPSHKSPSESSSDATSPTPSNNDSGGLPIATIIGVGAGVGILVFALLILFLCCCCKKKKKEKPIQYYSGLAPRNKGSQYYDNPQTPNWYNTDPHGKVTPPPGGMGQPGGLWAPPPPPPMMSSSEMSPGISGSNGMAPQSPSLGFSKSSFSYDELAAATNGFSQANLLGQGGFGYVHKGVFPNGKVVAVKSLKSGSGQGEREFQAEVEIISRVHHRHLVTLEGYCIAGGQRMLVYEFVPNKTLEFHLHGEDHTLLDWPKRLNIAIGSAKGLAYIHEDCHPRIIHRDIKTANILLDNNFEAMVADFGLAKLSQDNFTHVSTRIMGTFGYLAPEYASSGKLTEKSDVFSFGVMMLELITGRRPVDTTNSYMEDSLVDWARPLCARALENDDYDEIVDPKLENNYNPSEMKCMIACAAASVRHSAKRRPKMSQIVRALEGDVSLEDLNEMRGTPLNSVISTTPGTSTGTSNGNSSEYNTRMYNEDLSKFRKMALGSQAFESGVTSTYGLDPSSSSEFSSNSREMKHSQH